MTGILFAINEDFFKNNSCYFLLIFFQLTVPITCMLLWSEYNCHHALELLKVPRLLIGEKTDTESFHFIPKSIFKGI